MHPFKIAASF